MRRREFIAGLGYRAMPVRRAAPLAEKHFLPAFRQSMNETCRSGGSDHHDFPRGGGGRVLIVFSISGRSNRGCICSQSQLARAATYRGDQFRSEGRSEALLNEIADTATITVVSPMNPHAGAVLRGQHPWLQFHLRRRAEMDWYGRLIFRASNVG